MSRLNKNKYQLICIGLLIILIVIVRTGCQPGYNQPINVDKAKIKHHEQTRDSAKAKAAKTEVNQKEVRKVYRKHRNSSLSQTVSPCRDTIIQIIQLCDTVIFIDSVLIAELKEVIRVDSLIIETQKNIIRADSLTISDLTKSVKKEKRKKRLWQVLTAIAAGVAVAR